MSTTVVVYIANINDVMESYNQIRIYRSTSPYASFSEVIDARTTMVADQEVYNITDDDGDNSYFYYYTFFNTNTSNESGYSEIQFPNVTTLNRLRLEGALAAGAAFESRATDASASATTLRDATLRDNGLTTRFLEGAWVYRPAQSVSPTDKSRRVDTAGFDENDDLTVSRGWGDNGLTNGEMYQVFLYLPPTRQSGATISWIDVVNDALRGIRVRDFINVGEGTEDKETRFSLTPWQQLIRPNGIRAVWLRTTNSDGVIREVDAAMKGRFWRIKHFGPDMILEMFPAPRIEQTIFVEINRTYAPLYNDLDVTDCPYDLAIAAVRWRTFERLNRLQVGKYEAEAVLARREFNSIYQDFKASDTVRLT